MIEEYKFGICKCYEDYFDKNCIKHLKVFDKYHEAFTQYMKLISKANSYLEVQYWWIVYIDKDDNIVYATHYQFKGYNIF